MKEYTFEVPNQHPVTLRVRSGSFDVMYGKQAKTGLDYARACDELGSCLMHALACNGLMDDNREYINLDRALRGQS